MKTNPRRFLHTMLAACAIMFAASSAFGLGSDYNNDHPVTSPQVAGADSWPKGMEHLVNAAHRVHGFFVNDEDVFFFAGSAADFTAFLLEYSKIDPIRKHVLIIHGGSGKAMSPWGGPGVPCDWEIYGCSATRSRNAKDVKDPTAVSPWYTLEVHFWSGGKIDLKQVTVPKNIELRNATAPPPETPPAANK
jgi:hypothetical protein